MKKVKVTNRATGEIYGYMEIHSAARHLAKLLLDGTTREKVYEITRRLEAREPVTTTAYSYEIAPNQ